MNTAYPDFQDALYAVVNGATTTPVSLGWPTGGPKASHVWISGAGEIQLSDGVSGYGQRDETMTAEVRIKVDLATSTYTDARDAAFTISDAIEAALSADTTLGGVVGHARVTSIRVDEAVEERQRSVGIVLTVTADAIV
jgi:hypothetical protein